MLVWRTYTKTRTCYGVVDRERTYKWLLLFGFIPLFVAIDG